MITIIVSLLGVFGVCCIAFFIYCVVHAHKFGEERRLEFFLLRECFPPATQEEIVKWLEGV